MCPFTERRARGNQNGRDVFTIDEVEIGHDPVGVSYGLTDFARANRLRGVLDVCVILENDAEVVAELPPRVRSGVVFIPTGFISKQRSESLMGSLEWLRLVLAKTAHDQLGLSFELAIIDCAEL